MSDPSRPHCEQGSATPESPPRDRILAQVTVREGWIGDQRAAIDELCAFAHERHTDIDLHVLRTRLVPLFAKTTGLLAIDQPEGVKPATFIRNTIEDLRRMQPDEAVSALRRPHPVLREYLDLRLEAESVPSGQPADPGPESVQRATQRYALVMAPDRDLLPLPRRGKENPWATVADLIAELLADMTGCEPKRSWDAYKAVDSGWPLAFFERFAALAAAPSQPPNLDRIWRNALDARATELKDGH